jgi:hypothetical protein
MARGPLAGADPSGFVDRVDRGTLLVATGIGLFAVTLLASAALAPTLAVDGESDTRRTLVGSQGGGPGWHEYGSVYLLEGTDVAWRVEDADSYFDVTELPDGRILAGFMDGGRQSCGPYDAPCSRTGFQTFSAPPQPAVVDEYSVPVRTSKNSEVHDVEPLPGGGYLLTDMDEERIYITEDGEVTWEWRAETFYDAPEDPTRTDWLHVNDVDRLGEGRYLVSVRNANQLVIVTRGEGVVEVINADRSDSDDDSCRRGSGARTQLRDTDGDGDVRCGDPDVMNHQHNPQPLADGAVLVADSDNDRVVELHRENDTWEVAWTLDRAGGLDFSWPRDADRLENGNTLITDTLNGRILEVNRSGEVVWSYQTERIPYEADRLPGGESRSGPRYGGEGPGESTDPDRSPLAPVLVVMRAIAPWLPFWYGPLQLFATLLSIGLVGGGLWVRRGE